MEPFKQSSGAESVVVFSDDWGRHPSSCQHLVKLFPENWSITWVNTIGMRPPRFDRTTLQRVLEKGKQWLSRGTAEDANETLGPRVVSPKMWPWFRTSLDRRVNDVLLRRQLRSCFENASVAITTIPIVADIMQSCLAKHWVYYCVDDFSEWPGLDQQAMGSMEIDVIRNSRQIVTASQSLQARMLQLGYESKLLTHGVELSHWSPDNGHKVPSLFQDLESPYFLFWGVIDARLDVEFLRALATSMTGGTIILMGPQQNPPPEIANIPGVLIAPPVAFEDLPLFGQAADVLLMPYVDQPVTQAMQPLKLLEYLATGKPVVVRDLPATRPWADALELAKTPAEFSAKVLQAVQSGLPAGQRRARLRLAAESWASKSVQLQQIVQQVSKNANSHAH